MKVKRTGTVSFTYFDKDDYVITPEGVGIVLEDESKIDSEEDLRYSEVLIQHKSGISTNPSNAPKCMTRNLLMSIKAKRLT